jgi:hypothetical protein
VDPKRLEGFLDGLEDTPEYVSASDIHVDPPVDHVLLCWRTAAAGARHAYAAWRRCRNAAAYAGYRACADQADAAQDALAAR